MNAQRLKIESMGKLSLNAPTIQAREIIVKPATKPPPNRAKRRRHKAYTAEESGAESDSYSSGSDQNSSEETAAVSREQIRKIRIPPSSWVSDTAASSHMTDNSSLFRGSLIPLSRRRRIRVGSGELYSVRHIQT
ncbi:hypothetical protein K3495_g7321 [Podosphaera aphanis]|nr:hypothetical protein K3495_g7321 [Podosphaera aphanis]